jgi:hypothetical protein
MRSVLLSMLLVTAVQPAAGSMPDWSPSVGVQVTVPQKLSVSLGVSNIPWGILWGDRGGLLIRLEPGISGGKLHLGLRDVFSMALLPIFSADLCASVLYTWNDPWSGLDNDQTYLGAETRISMIPIIASAGVYRHVAGGDTEHDWVFSMGAGLGF